ncbi:MAG: response regulator [Lunatimonas sp.]|uniref:response regulator n=1 Tax=Lunatimonas sp. TaxID=2060141 RepID=UPI00263A411D|nr:response regulator [Lunatimonas sp.]MCC5938478.1 response regulator [Lunatimonas sp.]
MKSEPQFMLLDDDPINNMFNKMIIKKIYPDASLIAFEEPLKALEYLEHSFDRSSVEKTTLLLDINMPVMSGWEFMEEFENLETAIKERIVIYILSSSIDPRDIEKAKDNTHVINFIEKPLSADFLKSLV